MIQDMIPGTEEQLLQEQTTGYIGFDPTADSLHIGSLIPIILLVHLQKSGHKPIALVGGATGMVGDPSGKSEERNLLDDFVLKKNIAGIQAQLERFLDFSPHLPNAAEIANNYNWFKEISFVDFLRDTGKHITVNYMMGKESVRKRIEGDTGISFTEFTYQLMQGYDFYWLFTRKNCKLQMGGSDQWGNMTTGTELIRRKCGAEAFVLTTPLITKADGGKFGKTEKGNIWLDPARTSPYQFYQFWLNASDEDAEKWIRKFTFLTRDAIEMLIHEHRENPAERVLQKNLASEVTRFVHSEPGLAEALATTEKLFSGQHIPAKSLSEEDLEAMEGVVKSDISKEIINQGIDIVSFLALTNVSASKGEARKLILGGGVSLNRRKISDPQFVIIPDLLLHGKYLLLQKGKKNYHLIRVQS